MVGSVSSTLLPRNASTSASLRPSVMLEGLNLGGDGANMAAHHEVVGNRSSRTTRYPPPVKPTVFDGAGDERVSSALWASLSPP